jgi:hypothetical protein
MLQCEINSQRRNDLSPSRDKGPSGPFCITATVDNFCRFYPT